MIYILKETDYIKKKSGLDQSLEIPGKERLTNSVLRKGLKFAFDYRSIVFIPSFREMD